MDGGLIFLTHFFMIARRIVASAVISALLLTAVPAFAREAEPMDDRGGDSVCMKAAVEKHHESMKKARGTHKGERFKAVDVRKDAAVAAKALEDKDARKTAHEAARLKFKDAMKAAREAFKKEREAAHETFATAREACVGEVEHEHEED